MRKAAKFNMKLIHSDTFCRVIGIASRSALVRRLKDVSLDYTVSVIGSI